MSPDLKFELLAITSIVSFLVMGGLLGLWAATSRWHWFLRAMTVVCLLALVQWRPLYELYLTLLTQVVVIGVGVTVYRRELWKWRFSVAGLLMMMAVVAVVLASLMRQPEKEFGWQGGLMGVGFGIVGGLLTLLGAWLVMSQWRLRWRVLVGFLAILVLGYGWGLSNQLAHQFVEYNEDGGIFLPVPIMGTGESWPTMPWLCALGFAIIFVVVTWSAQRYPKAVLIVGLMLTVFPSYLVYCLSTPLVTQLERAPSSSYTALRAIGEDSLFEAIYRLTRPESVDTEAMAVAVREAESAYQQTRQLLDKSVDPGIDLSDGAVIEASGRRELALMWAWRATIYREAGDPLETSRSCEWLWRYVTRLDGPGLKSHALVNGGIEGLAAGETFNSLALLRREDCLNLARQISEFNEGRTPFKNIARCERAHSETASGWSGHWFALLNRWAEQGNSKSGNGHWSWLCQQKHEAVSTLLATELALRAYHLDKGAYPESLKSLVPAYLPHVPADPCSAAGEPIVYRKTDEGYTLYSRGYDQDDDNGRIPTAKWGPTDEWINWTSDGDLSLKEYFKDW